MRILLAILSLVVCANGYGAVINANSSSWVDVSNALFSASDFDTIAIPASSNAWTGELLVRKTGITFSGAGTTNSTSCAWIANAGTGLQDVLFNVQSNSCTFTNLTFSGTNTMRISGEFWGRAIDLAGYYGRITRCCFKFFDTAVIHHRPGTVTYNSTFIDNRIFGRCFGEGDGSANWTAYGPAGTLSYATTNFSFIEDCGIEKTSSMPGDTTVNWSSQQGQLWQIRRCNFADRSSWDYSPIFDSHGAFTGERSGIGALIASNFFDFSGSGASWDRFVDIRGGSAMIFGNVVTNAVDNTRAIFMRCKDGDETPFFQNGGIEQVTNVWYAGNTMNGSAFSVQVEANDSAIIVAGASYSNAVPPVAFWAPYPMPLRDDAQRSQSIPPTYPRIKGLRLSR